MDPTRQLLSESVKNKWKPILEHKALPEIKDNYKKHCTTVLLENQEQCLKEAQGILGTQLGTSNAGAGTTTGIDSFDPILISLVRRAMPNLMAYDIAGVQPMTGPTGLIFAMKSRYGGAADSTGLRSGAEALFGEADTGFGNSSSVSGKTGSGAGSQVGNMGDIFQDDLGTTDGRFEPGRGMSTSIGENLGGGASVNGGTYGFNEMSFTIEKTAVEAKTRALKAEYTIEMAQDLKAVHGLDAETELANILSTEIMFEINRELVRLVYDVAKLGAQQADIASKTTAVLGSTTGGVYDLEKDSDGRWSAEKFRGLLFQIEREANQIGAETRRGRGNMAIVSPDVASALAMSGILDFSPAFNSAMNTDVNGNTLAGTISGGKIKVYIDPYSVPTHIDTFTPVNYVCVGYKGASPYDAGIFYCPYVPLQMVRAVDTSTFQPKIGFKTRYGIVSNPYVLGADNSPDAMRLQRRRNQYYRIFRVDSLHGNDASYGG
jgi:hypothetical protein